MHRRAAGSILRLVIVVSMLVLGVAQADAQARNLNAFSPYTMYGLGDLQQVSSAEYAAMGGIGVAVREGYSFNYANPASLSAMPQRSAILNFGGQSRNTYSRTALAKTSYNSVNLHDFGFAVPLARGVGLGVALLPYSAVGYANVLIKENDPVTDNIGRSIYSYDGDGGVSQLQASVGVLVARGFSLGAGVHYYFGNLNRYYTSYLYSYLNEATYRTVSSSDVDNVSTATFEIGAQYQFRVGKDAGLTIGATYQTAARTSLQKKLTQVSTSAISMDTIQITDSREGLTIPQKISVGLHYSSPKVGFGVDYIYQDWRNAFALSSPEISLAAMHEVKAGVSFTPNRADMRNFLNRWTYKFGVRYSSNYLRIDNKPTNDYAVTLGFDIPLRRASMSKVSIGAEVGHRGVATGKQVEETYFRIVAGFSFFGEDMWFTRVKFD